MSSDYYVKIKVKIGEELSAISNKKKNEKDSPQK